MRMAEFHAEQEPDPEFTRCDCCMCMAPLDDVEWSDALNVNACETCRENNKQFGVGA